MASITQHRFTEHIPLAGYVVRMQRDDLPEEVNSAFAMAAKAIRELGDRCDKLESELTAYKRAKAENDERFMIERDEASGETKDVAPYRKEKP